MRSLAVMLFIVLFAVGLVNAQNEIPYRVDSTFKFELDYNFKRKPPPPSDKVTLVDVPHTSNEVLPYVIVKFTVAEPLKNDHRVKVIDNYGRSVLNRKIRDDLKFDIDMGFAEDLKDRIVPHQYNIFFINQEKNTHSRITLEVTEEGDLLLNSELYGKL